MDARSEALCPHNGTSYDGTLLCYWSNSSGARGTLNIFWLCISTLGLCVWNAVHPDIPRPKTPEWRVFGKRVWWLFVGLFMPEILVLVALSQFRQACQLLVDIDKYTSAPTQFPWWMYLFESWRPMRRNPEYETKWWMRCLFSCLRMPRAPSWAAASDPEWGLPNAGPAEKRVHGREHHCTLTHSFYAVMHGFVDVDEAGHVVYVDFLHRLTLPNSDSRHLPDLSVDDINDRGKAGIFAKSLLVWQLFYFLSNCFARWHHDLPLSLLEITTISHSLCSIIAMLLWWYKPHSVGETTVIDRRGPITSTAWRTSLSRGAVRDILNRGWNKIIAANPRDVPRTIAIIAISVLYGPPHLLGLSVHFPSAIEKLCWQIATLLVIGLPLVMCLLLWSGHIIKHLGCREKTSRRTVNFLMIFILVLYPIASVLLVGESLRQVFALPKDSFQEPQLTRFLPSFS